MGFIPGTKGWFNIGKFNQPNSPHQQKERKKKHNDRINRNMGKIQHSFMTKPLKNGDRRQIPKMTEVIQDKLTANLTV